jgi:hypothetical protein
MTLDSCTAGLRDKPGERIRGLALAAGQHVRVDGHRDDGARVAEALGHDVHRLAGGQRELDEVRARSAAELYRPARADEGLVLQWTGKGSAGPGPCDCPRSVRLDRDRARRDRNRVHAGGTNSGRGDRLRHPRRRKRRRPARDRRRAGRPRVHARHRPQDQALTRSRPAMGCRAARPGRLSPGAMGKPRRRTVLAVAVCRALGRENLNLAVVVEPDEIRWADEILKALQALAEAQRILEVAPDATRNQLGPLLCRGGR